MATACPWGIGAKTKTLIAPEATYGTLPSTIVAYNLPFNSNGVQASQNISDSGTIRGTRSPAEGVPGNIDVAGDIVVPVDYVAFGYWLKMCFDEPSTTVITADTKWQHVFKIGAGMPSFTMEQCFPGIGQYTKISGCKISKLSLSFGGDGELTATLSVVGKKAESEDSQLVETPTEVSFSKAHNLQAQVKIGGSVVGKVSAFSLDVDFGVDTEGYAIGGNGFREAACDGICAVNGTMEVFFADDTYTALAANSTETSAEIVLTHGEDESLSFKLPEIKFALTGTPIEGPTAVKQSLNYNAFYDNSTEASAVVVTLKNAQEEY